MRMITLVALAASLVLLQSNHADAQTYPFCASYNDETGASNCGFATMEQCRAAISGAGGFCGVNPVYQAERNSTPRRPPRRR
jgi:hypothetical protein